MTGTEKQTVLTRARELAGKLLSALGAEDHDTAAQLAEAIGTAGVQSLDRLTPRGTLRFPAGNRWGDSLTREVLAHLKRELPEAVTAQLLAVLGYWAGEEAVPTIRQLLIERAQRASSGETARTVQNGLHALHLIGGPRAVQALQDFQGEGFPEGFRRDAAWFLNELGARILDSRFASERTPDSAEEVLRRDSLDDPYEWRPAAVRLGDYLAGVGSRYLAEYPDALRSALPEEEAAALSSALGDGPAAASWGSELLDALEPVVPQFMIRLAPSEVLALEPVVRFFPSADVEDLTEIRTPRDWCRLGLVPGSTSATHLNPLPLFDPGECDVYDESHIRSVLWDWLSVPLHLARTFRRRRHYPLAFSMAAVEDHLHRELEFARGVPFPDVLRSVFKVAATPQSQV